MFAAIVLVYTARDAWAQDEKGVTITPVNPKPEPSKAGNSCTDKDTPKVDDQDCAEVNDLARQSLQIYIQLKNVQQKYNDARDADPQWSDLNRQNTEVGAKLQAAVTRIQNKIDKDQKTWVFNPATMKPQHPAPPAATAEKK